MNAFYGWALAFFVLAVVILRLAVNEEDHQNMAAMLWYGVSVVSAIVAAILGFMGLLL